MKFIRGTTPTVMITVQNEIDLHQVAEVWIYVSQQNKVKIDKDLEDVTFDYENRKMSVTFTQEDTLGLRQGDALFQMRVLLLDGTALATTASNVDVLEVYKSGQITPDDEEEVSG